MRAGAATQWRGGLRDRFRGRAETLNTLSRILPDIALPMTQKISPLPECFAV
jgi:hypothetical protein